MYRLPGCSAATRVFTSDTPICSRVEKKGEGQGREKERLTITEDTTRDDVVAVSETRGCTRGTRDTQPINIRNSVILLREAVCEANQSRRNPFNARE